VRVCGGQRKGIYVENISVCVCVCVCVPSWAIAQSSKNAYCSAIKHFTLLCDHVCVCVCVCVCGVVGREKGNI